MTERTLLRALLTTFAGLDRTECWVWPGTIGNHGYGVVCGQLVHRMVFELLVGPIPEGLQLDHLCRNRPCANPHHLEAVTRRENILRGECFSAVNAKKTHCANGHEYNAINTYQSKNNQRKCKICHREYEAARRQRARA